MTKPAHKIIRDYLRARHPQGVETTKIAKLLGINSGTVYTALREMPDTYIASWRVSPQRTAVWSIVIPPPDCPPPPVVIEPRPATKRPARSTIKALDPHQPTGAQP